MTHIIKGVRCSRCGEEIFSMHRHDYVTCRCGATMVDGGSAYIRAGGEPEMEAEGGGPTIVRRQSKVGQVPTAPDDWIEEIPQATYVQMLEADSLEDITDAWNASASPEWLKKPVDTFIDGKMAELQTRKG